MVPKGGLPASVLLLFVAAVALPLAFAKVAQSKPDSEVGRIKRQLERVERQLLARDAGALLPAQALARGEQIARLHEYRMRGLFPHNHDFPGKAVPYFVDRHGTLCAMAYLIAASGRGDIVRAVSTERNNATVMELAADPSLGPVLSAWLDRAGLTVEEAQSIQPVYEERFRRNPEDETTTSYAVSSGIVGALNVVSVGINGTLAGSGRGPRWIGGVGLAAGGAGIGLGIANWKRNGGRGNIAVANLALGALSTVMSAFALADKRERAPVWAQTDPPRLSLSPELRWRGTAGATAGVRAFF